MSYSLSKFDGCFNDVSGIPLGFEIRGLPSGPLVTSTNFTRLCNQRHLQTTNFSPKRHSHYTGKNNLRLAFNAIKEINVVTTVICSCIGKHRHKSCMHARAHNNIYLEQH